MKVKDYKPKYDVIESFKTKPDGTLISFNMPKKWEKFKKMFADCYIYSVRVYNDTKTVSIAYGNEKPIEKTYFSYTVPYQDGKSYLIIDGEEKNNHL